MVSPNEEAGHVAKVAPRGERMLALKARAVLVEGDLYDLFSEL